MRLPRPRFTIMGLMILVVIASLMMMAFVKRIELNRRVVALQVAQAKYEYVRLARKAAENAVCEYIAIYEPDLRTAENEIALAKSDLELALTTKGSDGQGGEDASIRLERAQKKRADLETPTKDKRVGELMGEVAETVVTEEAAKAAFDQLTAAVANAWW
jgi:hypothetical protein